MPTSSQPEPSRLGQAALLGAVTWATLQARLDTPVPALPDPNLERLWRGLLIEFNALHMDRVRSRLSELDQEGYDRHWQRESAWHAEFLSRSYARLRRDLNVPVTAEKLEEILKRERYWAGLHFFEATRRARRVVEQASLRAMDTRPDRIGGAEWRVNPYRQNHSPDCLTMNGRTWSWRVLRFISPANRHPGCGCSLHRSSSPAINEFPANVPRGFDLGQFRGRIVFSDHSASASDLRAALR